MKAPNFPHVVQDSDGNEVRVATTYRNWKSRTHGGPGWFWLCRVTDLPDWCEPRGHTIETTGPFDTEAEAIDDAKRTFNPE